MVDDDPIRTFSPEEQRRLTENLRRITEQVHAREFVAREVDRTLLLEFHRAVFGGVRDHAGCIRSKDFGTERLVLGPNRSTQKGKVPEEVEGLLTDARRMIASLLANREDPDYDEKAVHIAAWIHARVLQIHPFEDGNGRTSRLIMNYVLVVAGLRPVAVEAVKKEYTDCLNAFFRHGDLQPTIDLFLRLMTD